MEHGSICPHWCRMDAQARSHAENPRERGHLRQSQGHTASLVEDSRYQLRPEAAGQPSLSLLAAISGWRGEPPLL